MTRTSKMLFAGMGLLMFAVGTVGAILPVMPTVPFYLVAAFCFAKGSERLDTWFKNTRLYKQSLGRIFEMHMTLWLKIILAVIGTAASVAAFLFCSFKGWIAPCIVVCILWTEMVIYLLFIIKTGRKSDNDSETSKK